MKALLAVDIQNDLIPGGSSEAQSARETIDYINTVMKDYQTVIATKLSYSPRHCKFASRHQDRSADDMVEVRGRKLLLTAEHCIQGSFGARFPENLHTQLISYIILKGTDPKVDSCSGFYDAGRHHDTGLLELLSSKGITELDIVGFSLEDSLINTVMDALDCGLRVRVLTGGCLYVDRGAGIAMEEAAMIKKSGAEII